MSNKSTRREPACFLAKGDCFNCEFADWCDVWLDISAEPYLIEVRDDNTKEN